jgi:NRPS condensation-like uncharacterized protein
MNENNHKGLSPKQRLELLKRLKNRNSSRKSLPFGNANLPSQSSLPLSPTQTSLLEPEHSTIDVSKQHLSTILRLRGPLDTDVLRQSFLTLVQRHQALRTVVHESNNNFTQEISPISVLPLTTFNLTEIPDDERESRALQEAVKNVETPFNLETGPLIRTSLYKISEQHHLLLINFHYVVTDEWSAKMLIKELSVLYEALSLQKTPILPKLSIQYSDFILWQKKRLKSTKIEPSLSFWKSKLKPPFQSNVFQSAHPQQVSFDESSLYICNETLSALKALCKKEKISISMALLGTFFKTLHNVTQCSDIIIRSQATLRTKTEFEHLMGHLNNHLLIRNTVTDPNNISLKDLRKTVLESLDHQHIPEPVVVNTLRSEYAFTPTQLHTAEYIHEDNQLPKVSIGELEISPVKTLHSHLKSTLNLKTIEKKNGIVCQFIYDSSILSEEMILTLKEAFFSQLNSLTGSQNASTLLPSTQSQKKSKEAHKEQDKNTNFAHAFQTLWKTKRKN